MIAYSFFQVFDAATKAEQKSGVPGSHASGFIAPTRRQRRLYCCLAVLRWVATDFWLASVLQAASLSALNFLAKTRLISGYIDRCAIAGVVQRFAVAALAIASRSSHE